MTVAGVEMHFFTRFGSDTDDCLTLFLPQRGVVLNNFFWPFIVLDRQNPTLPVALSLLQSNYFVDYSIVLAGVVLAAVPLLLLFIFAGRQLVSGIMAGAVKG